MWKKVLVFVVLALICPVTECSKKKNKGPTNSKICQRTNSNVFRYCTRRSCSSDGECRNNEKCLCDGDCGMSCVKNKLRCKQPPKPKNSQQTLSNGLNFGSVVTYKCSGKYKLRGSASRTCRAIGKWDGRKARCRIICDDPGDIAFGNRRYDGFQAGKYITYWCYDAYEMVGTPRIRCKDNGKWSAPRPKCELPRCTPPPIPDDAEVIHPKRMPKTFKHSDIVLLNCKVGYFKIGIGALRCKKNDIWTGGIKCSPKSCGRPNPVSHGRIIGYVYSFKHKVRYSCNEGYELNGPAYRQCQANEKWSGRDPTCDAVDCGPLSKPADGDIIERVAFTYGNRIVFKCKSPGYEMKGSRTRTCQSDGNWSGSLTTCEIVKCGDPGNPANGRKIDIKKGFVYLGSVTFECNERYTLEGAKTVFCRADKSWSTSLPRCLAPCPDPGVPYRGSRMDEDFRHDRTVRFTCPRDYVREGVAEITCTDGRWNNNKPSCKAPCKKPGNPTNGWKSGQDFKHGDSVTFYCYRGYHRVGAFSITCNDGDWDNNFPLCKGVCGRPHTSPTVRLHGNSYLDGDNVTFSCSNNRDLLGKAKLHCVNQAWDFPVPECKARCRFMGRPEHGSYIKGKSNKGSMVKHGERIAYRCFRTYTLVGNNAQECNDGRWTNPRPSCKASCLAPVRIKHGFRNGDDYGHGKTIRYQCNPGYTVEGNDQLTCNDGNWNSDPPSCKAPCKEPANPTNGRKSGRDFKNGRSVTFYCNRGYQRVGAASITCRDGKWDNHVPLCKGDCGRPRTSSRVRLQGNRYLHGDIVTFICLSNNHDLFGKARLHCVDQAWDFPAPECKGRCTFDGALPKGYILNRNLMKGSTVQHNSIVEFACDRSYTLTGSKVLSCDDGRWNSTVPSCKASCRDPGFLDRGNRTGNDFSHGQMVAYQCAQGYSLDGPQILTCVDGNWDSASPQCKASCDPLQAPRDGKIYSKSTKHGALVAYSCNNGFTMIGSATVKCSDGKWNGSTPTCKGSCKNPGPLKNGKIIGNDFTYGSTVKFQCDDHYELTGSQFASCVRGQWNTSVPKCWKRCQYPVIPKDGGLFGNTFAHGGTVTIVCRFQNGSFDLASQFKIKCNNGSWSRPLPTCEVPCNNPGKPSNGTKHGDDYRSGAKVTFSCDNPFKLEGSPQIVCRDGKWSHSTPTCSNCGRPLGMENNRIQDFRITSLTASHVSRSPKYARLNGPSSWCSGVQTYLQIDLGRTYQVAAISTQGGAMDSGDKWVKQYKVSFYAGATQLMYSESGLQKTIQGNRDASSVVRYQLKEPFVTKKLRIYPVSITKPFCLRIEIYGCDPNPECILPGSLFYGFWRKGDNSNNYFRAFITNVDHTHIDFALEVNKNQKRRYKKTDPVLIINKIPEMKEISVNAPVIAVHIHGRTEWYRAGKVAGIRVKRSLVLVKFDNGDYRLVPLKELLLVRHPRFC